MTAKVLFLCIRSDGSSGKAVEKAQQGVLERELRGSSKEKTGNFPPAHKMQKEEAEWQRQGLQ